MPFPESARVRYGKNPLIEVVCQLKFPTILRIDTETPAAFQERVRHAFPEYRTDRNRGVQLPAGVRLPADVMQMLVGGAGPVAHEFLTADGKSRLSLTRDFLALSTGSYSEWKDFFGAMRAPIDALRDVYNPPYFTRVGLRYRDQIDRAKLGLSEVPWSELLRAEVAGELADASVGPRVERVLREVGIRLPDDAGQLRMVHGLDGDGPSAPYMIDVDFFTEGQIPTGGTADVLGSFNRRAGNLFRWSLKPRLHAAMDPRPA